MVGNLKELNEKIEMINALIPSFDTEERKEIKKNNKLITDYIEELVEVKKVLLEVIRDKKEKMIPTLNDELTVDITKEIDNLYDSVMFLSNNGYMSKFNIDKNLHEIRYSGSLDRVNDNISDLVNKFLLVGVKLESNDFKYSLSLYKYMDFFFKNRSDEEFNKLIANLFDSLYWECSDIIYHIYLSFMLLIEKYKDKFETYIKSKNEGKEYDIKLKRYLDLKIEKENKINCDVALNYNKFLNNEYRIEDYLIDGVFRKETVSKYVDYEIYKNYSLEDKNYFYEQINGMYLDFCEYLSLSKYKFLIDKVKEIYSNKASYVGAYNNLKKSIKKIDKQREQLNNKLFSTYNRLGGKTRGLLFNKYNSLYNKVNIKITEVIESYKNYDDESFINDVVTKLNDDSTVYDALKIYENNFSYLCKLLNENDCSYEDFIEFLYNPYLNICKSITFINEIDIKDKLINKYDLFDMNFNISDEGKLYEELRYIVRLWHFDRGNINLDNIKLIIDINKIKMEEI